MKHVLALMVAFTALVGSAVLLFVAEEQRWQPQQASPYIASEAKTFFENSEGDLPDFSSPLAAASNVRSDTAVLDNDQDHDGNYDRLADPLAGLNLGTAVLVIVVGLVALGGGRLLLALYEVPKLSSFWPLALERPG